MYSVELRKGDAGLGLSITVSRSENLKMHIDIKMLRTRSPIFWFKNQILNFVLILKKFYKTPIASQKSVEIL